MEVKGGECTEGARTMAVLLLFVARHLTEAASDTGHEKERVVPEALVAAGLGKDESRTCAKGTEASSVGRVQHCGAGIVGRALFGRDRAELMEQVVIVRAVLVAAGAVVPGRESAGAYAGRSAERVDADAGVVGNGGHPGESEKIRCLGVRVREEGVAGLDVVFDGVVWHAGISERDNVAVEQRREDFSNLARLVRTAGSKNDGRSRSSAGGHRASAAR